METVTGNDASCAVIEPTLTKSNTGTPADADNINPTLLSGAAKVTDPTLPGAFTFYQRAELGGTIVYSAQHTITVTCGAASSVVTAPSILSLTGGDTEYKIYSPASTYTLLNAFTVSNTNCGLSSLRID